MGNGAKFNFYHHFRVPEFGALVQRDFVCRVLLDCQVLKIIGNILFTGLSRLAPLSHFTPLSPRM